MKNVEVTRLHQIYSSSNGDVKVYRGEMTGSALPVAIKEQRFDSVEASNLAVQEALVQKSFHHPNICKLYSVNLTSEGSRILVTSLLEWMDQGDLYVEIERRRTLQELFTELELFGYLRDLTNAFATAQRLGICHRDIKPQNLLLNSGVIKICDFGCSKEVVDNLSSLQGSPYFLSPVLKEVLRDNFGSETYPAARHDAYKSDVYSLGLTFLFMAMLRPSEGITHLESLHRETQAEVSSLPYSSEFKDLLLSMLTEDEGARPDFLDLEAHLNSMQLVGLEEEKEEEEKVPAPLVRTPEPDWVVHLRSNKPVVVTITLPLVCTQCSKSYLLDVTHGCSNIMDLYFCQPICFDAYYSPAPVEPERCGVCGALLSAGTCSKKCTEVITRRQDFETSKELMKTQRICYICGKKLTKVDGAECAECHQKELKRWVVKEGKTHMCIFCHGKWEKKGWGMGWFRKKEGRIKLKCGHRFCSRVCFDRFAQSNRACTSCGKVLDASFLKLMKIG